MRHVRLVKKGKAQTETEVVKEEECGEPLKSIKEIPKELKLFEKWDYQMIKGFMMEQGYESLKIGFIQCLQAHLTELYDMIKTVKEEQTSGRKDKESKPA